MRIFPKSLHRVQFEDILIADQDIAEPLDVRDDLLDRNMFADALSEVINTLFMLGVRLVVSLTALGMFCLHFKQIRILYCKKISY